MNSGSSSFLVALLAPGPGNASTQWSRRGSDSSAIRDLHSFSPGPGTWKLHQFSYLLHRRCEVLFLWSTQLNWSSNIAALLLYILPCNSSLGNLYQQQQQKKTFQQKDFFLPAPLHHYGRSSPALPMQSSVAKYIGGHLHKRAVWRQRLPQCRRKGAAASGEQVSGGSLRGWPLPQLGYMAHGYRIKDLICNTTSRDVFFISFLELTLVFSLWQPLPRDETIPLLLMLLLSPDPGSPSIHASTWAPVCRL